MTARDPPLQLSARMQGTDEWMAEEAPYVAVDQRHFDAITLARAYWHRDYQAALG